MALQQGSAPVPPLLPPVLMNGSPLGTRSARAFDLNGNQLIYNEAVVRALANHPMKR